MSELESLNGRSWVTIIQAMSNAITEACDQLTAMDSEVGDGDHGVNMTAAMQAAATQVSQLVDPTPDQVLKTAGTAVLNEMGGASGVVFGSFFRGGSRAVKGKSSLGLAEVAVMMNAGLAEVQKRGKAQPGDKTMVDALAAAATAVQLGLDNQLTLTEAITNAAAQATIGAEDTRNMVAQFGRAKFLGERSIGHQDAGATSIAIMITVWADVLRETN
ncbi:MAG: dihydroxyacetone kinase subunit L [Chloroflexi bacterium]|nr:dihydroxyacetone kinase subunit L [Chloroflexota bacterium]